MIDTIKTIKELLNDETYLKAKDISFKIISYSNYHYNIDKSKKVLEGWPKFDEKGLASKIDKIMTVEKNFNDTCDRAAIEYAL